MLGTILLTVQRSKLTASLRAQHVPHAAQVASRISQSQGGHSVSSIPHYYSVDFSLHADPIRALRPCAGHGGFAGVVALSVCGAGLQEPAGLSAAGAVAE